MRASLSSIPVVSSFEAVFSPSFDDRPIRRASWVSILTGFVGGIGLSALFVMAAPLMELAGNRKLGLFALAPTLLLLLSVGGYGMLAFYGLRLRYLWSRRFLPPVPGERHNLRTLALMDLKKIRWYSGAILLMILACYLLPEDSPALIGTSEDWASPWDRGSESATQQVAILWIILTVLPVLFARWAAWEVAAAAGDLTGPDDSRAFQVVAPSAAAPQPTLHGAGALLAAVPLSDGELRGLDPVIKARPGLSEPSENQDPFERFAASERLATRRDWELVLLMSLVLLLLVCVGFADEYRAMREVLSKPTVWFTRYQQVQAIRSPGVTSTHPIAGVLTLLCPFLLWVLSLASILWTALCLMSGPRWRGVAILLMACGTCLIAVNTVAMSLVAPYWMFLRSMVQQPPVRIEKAPWTSLNLAIILLALLVVLTRPSMRMLFDQSVRKRRAG